MKPRKPAYRILQSISGPNLSVSQSFPVPNQRSLAITPGLMAILLLITLLTAAHVSGQATPAAEKPPNLPVLTQVATQVTNQGLPPVMTPQRRPSQSSQPAPTDPPKDVTKILAKKGDPRRNSSLAPVVPSPEPTASSTSQNANEPTVATTPQNANEPPALTTPQNANGQTAATAPQSGNEPLPFMADTETEKREQPPSASGLLVRTLGALLLIIGLIVAAGWGIKRFGGARFGNAKEKAPGLSILNSVSLGERRSLMIVRYGDRTLLLGSTAQSVTLLAEDETEDFEAHPRSVADILNDEEPVAFSQELFSATRHLREQIATRH
jgi:flagellar protein FliO/FliZ